VTPDLLIYERFLALMLVSLAGVVLGVSYALFKLTTLRRQFVAFTVIGGTLAAGLTSQGSSFTGLRTVLVVGLPLFSLVAVLGNANAQQWLNGLQKPFVMATAILLVSVGVGVSGSWYYDVANEDNSLNLEEGVAILNSKPPSAPVEQLSITTDQGTPISVSDSLKPRTRQEIVNAEIAAMARLNRDHDTIQTQLPRDGSNCHGWTFTQNLYAVANQSVDVIVRENGYQVVREPKPGDLVVYRDSLNEVSHTALVRYVTSGLPVLVEGKWGWMGVYLHDVEKSCYGTNYTYYRSSRPDHALRGLDGQTYSRTAAK
jgi:hypothetical protein